LSAQACAGEDALATVARAQIVAVEDERGAPLGAGGRRGDRDGWGASVETLTIATANDADEFVMRTAFAFVGIAGRRSVRSSADARVGRVAEDEIIA
jgi:hypothetical protein